MLRFLSLISLCLLIVFTGIGVLVSRQWGWSEYASPELYLVYVQGDIPDSRYFMVNASGKSQAQAFARKNEPVFALGCSPDGRTLAVLTTPPHLYVMTAAGLEYDKILGKYLLFDYLLAHDFFDMSVANDGTVTLPLPDPSAPTLVNSTETVSLVPPQRDRLYAIRTSSQGFALWHDLNGESQVFSPTGTPLMSLPGAFTLDWLTSEKDFSFHEAADQPDGRVDVKRYLADATSQVIVRLADRLLYGLFSPDGTKIAFSAAQGAPQTQQIYLRDFSDSRPDQQLTHDGSRSQPVCFLTFLPQMLINQ